MSIRTTSPFRADFVGSFLRPDKLKNARNLHRQGILSDADLKKVEDECIEDLVAKQVSHGLRAITDGEFRRSWWHYDFFWGLNGLEKITAKKTIQFSTTSLRPESVGIVGRITGDNHPFVEHFKFVKNLESKYPGVTARQTIPAPAQLLSTLLNVRKTEGEPKWPEFYDSLDDLIADLGKAYRKVRDDLYAAGCRSLQIDDCTWPLLCDKEKVEQYHLDVDALAETYLKANNEVFRDKPKDLTITGHVCRGNFRSTFFSSGGYDRVAETLFARENLDAFYLEYDSERAGSFAPLKSIPKDRLVVLGIVTTKTPELEDLECLEKRVREAAEYFPLENLCVSPQCGFSSTEEGNSLTEEEQWRKIDLVRSLAKKVFGE